MSSEHWEEFYSKNSPPQDFERSKQRVEDFCQKFRSSNTNVVLVTVSVGC